MRVAVLADLRWYGNWLTVNTLVLLRRRGAKVSPGGRSAKCESARLGWKFGIQNLVWTEPSRADSQINSPPKF